MFEFIPFAHCGIVKSKLDKNLLLELKNQCLDILNNKSLQIKHNNYLSGNIKNEFLMPKNENLSAFLSSMAYFYCDSFNFYNHKNPTSKNFNVDNMWINFQKKYEFNPVHMHQGFLSFVIWIQIPYDLKKEKENEISKESNYNTVTDFYYLEPFNLTSIELSKEDEGDVIMFSSGLMHGVNPFYFSDGYRISIAGNISEKKFTEVKYG